MHKVIHGTSSLFLLKANWQEAVLPADELLLSVESHCCQSEDLEIPVNL